MKVKEIQNRFERGYTNSVYGNSANAHEQMTNDIKTLLEVICNTCCSLELNGKDTPTFEEFKQENFKEVRSGVYNSYNMKEDLSSNDVLFKYIDFYFNPLIT
ncbi:hypothetical protein AVT42_gp51 [Polaribacter phage P12002S]|uniref:Uncharacterized protein n=1 Tax=Polaribacter phage P12002S TaxID=1647387 RepID=A0A0F7IK10_9CAUD|nr:hypothetical protein AVT42_gp51 [Polaribacter phage P12002S]AKG94307.1 hypothetical protein P12002S_0051 [Polaribacter phage P12002S]